MKELESQWWILASIELTQLPSNATTNSSTTQRAPASGKDRGAGQKTLSADVVEYSSREVASPQLLLSQLTQAYRIFLLHHASSLSELWKKHSSNRQHFCNLLDRYWTRFIWNWDVLLHGHPAVELFDGIKLAGGGELGIGVGEEGWGSGEREVLEDFASRTEGLLDLVVGRYGDAPLTETDLQSSKYSKGANGTKEPDPWLGNAESSRAQDGIIFSGIGGVSRRSLATISQWMESIFVHGESAYGVGENPASRPRHRKKTRKTRGPGVRSRSNHEAGRLKHSQHQRLRSPHGQVSQLHKKAIENNVNSPRIPAPLVSVVENSLNDAVAAANARASGQSPEPNQGQNDSNSAKEIQGDGALFGTDKMMKYLSLGYGSSWTLNPRGFGSSHLSSETKPTSASTTTDEDVAGQSQAEDELHHIDPTPEVSDEDEVPYVQRLEQSIGRFLIGLSGDLENTEFEQDEADMPEAGDVMDSGTTTAPSPSRGAGTPRLFLRTLTVEMSSARLSNPKASRISRLVDTSSDSKKQGYSAHGEDKTSAGASVDGSHPNISHEKVQIAVYVHQPFMFVFLFQLRTPNLTMPAFYRSIHHTLGPLQKSLLRSTDLNVWQERLQEALSSELQTDAVALEEQRSKSTPQAPLEIYDFVYDPAKLTIRTSIPNIPMPGSLAAEGLHRYQQSQRPITVSGSWYTLGIPIGTPSTSGASSPASGAGLVKRDWTRVDALNTYTHLLNIWVATRCHEPELHEAGAGREEIERSVKTSRGWWVAWMRISAQKEPSDKSKDTSSTSHDQDKGSHTSTEAEVREAFLIRRSPQEQSSARRDASGSRGDSKSIISSGRWLLREQPRSRDVSGSKGTLSASSATTSPRAVSEGVGVDARKWVERLVRLSM